jgi:hypothetical protein
LVPALPLVPAGLLLPQPAEIAATRTAQERAESHEFRVM